MNESPPFLPVFSVGPTTLLLVTVLLTGCAVSPQPVALLDLGATHNRQKAPKTAIATLPPMHMADIDAPAWLDGRKMFYRLNYANPLVLRTYAASQWSMPPAQLLAQHIKNHLAQTGDVVMPATHGARDMPLLRLELREFSQHFQSVHESTGDIILHASLYEGRVLRAQKTFMRSMPATTPDAQGAAAALSAASDAIIQDLRTWLIALQQS